MSELRRVTVCKCHSSESANGGIGCVRPAIQLCGEWLRRAGFEVGTVTDVLVQDGRLTISARRSAPPPKEATERLSGEDEEFLEALQEDLRPDLRDFYEQDPDGQ